MFWQIESMYLTILKRCLTLSINFTISCERHANQSIILEIRKCFPSQRQELIGTKTLWSHGVQISFSPSIYVCILVNFIILQTLQTLQIYKLYKLYNLMTVWFYMSMFYIQPCGCNNKLLLLFKKNINK